MRPGAGYLPTLALGRPRGSPTRARHVRAPSRGSRQAYHLYTEEEYLNAEDLLGSEWGEAPRDCSPVGACAPSPWGRRAGIAALTASLAVVAGVVAIDELRHGVGGESAGRMIALGASAEKRPGDRSVAIDPEAPRPIDPGSASREMSRPGQARRAPVTDHPGRRITEHVPAVARAQIPSRSRPVATLATAPAGTAPAGTAPAGTGPAGTAPVAAPTATASSAARARRPEFGFEQ